MYYKFFPQKKSAPNNGFQVGFLIRYVDIAYYYVDIVFI
jgi:hypothetical protein